MTARTRTVAGASSAVSRLHAAREVLVYGDARHEVKLARRARDLAGRLAQLERARGPRALDACTALLVLLGQVEQGLADDPEIEPALVGYALRASDAAAELLLRAGRPGLASRLGTTPAESWAAIRAAIEVWSQSDRLLQLKVPEGFVFYDLRLEAYLELALRWARETPLETTVAVVGLRSIGTTLSAAVTVALRAAGFFVRRTTVRPSGHPFRRSLELERTVVAGARRAIVVDEGPGLSGSSMAAAAVALERAGFSRDALSFFTAHARGPGAEASAEIRSLWSSVRVWSADSLGPSFASAQAVEAAAVLLGADPAALRVEALSGGRWRDLVYAQGRPRPPSLTPFERVKYRVRTEAGATFVAEAFGSAWVDVGYETSAEVACARLGRRARQGWSAAPIGALHGYVFRPWMEGVPSFGRCRQALAVAAKYVAEPSDEYLSAVELEAAFTRLEEMMVHNVTELFPRLSGRVDELCRLARHRARAAARALDHRLGPEHFLVQGGKHVKVGGAARDVDHTLVGPQPRVWDVVGVLVEWGLSSASRLAAFFADYAAHRGAPIGPEELRFHRVAYAALRAGQCAIARAALPDGSEEARRHDRALARYRGDILRTLEVP